ncbi:SulP family inorganic anion transporter [Segetibacter sp.]|jgi:MFS superfamily sulfate permease-like transporter|uniref:SulP family inorganic anion transporter n=1 Tax=Segetibacter sp. TaxID=2231182 RepID=UPI0026113B19|nr:SulP family inorganic anion transporter [Segetibacter sp.]MCW3080271.1 sulfate transporter [Segetibacter sp.]
MENKSLFKELKSDLPASIVVFFVALPLCLGIALASGAPLFSGIIAGIVGGIIVGSASGSPLGVSGPAAGLAVIVFTAIGALGSWPAFLLSVVVAGVLQLAMGFARAGFIAYFFPSSVIKGMLTGIGLLIILKQIPHAIGYDKNPEGSDEFLEASGENSFSAIGHALEFITPGAVLIAVISLVILILWDTVLSKKHKIFQLLQGPIVVVLLGILMNYLYQQGTLNFSLAKDQLVQLPVAASLPDFLTQFTLPDFSQLSNLEVYKTAVVLAIVASLETLLCVEATDKMDPYKRVTPTNRELKAQGLGNVISGLIGGLPITQVIVRSSANIAFGAKTKMSAILHGFLLLICAITIAGLLNMIPLASLAAILIMVGYKLAKPTLFKQMYKQGWEQFVPFIATVVAILLTDLLRGISIGLLVGLFFTLRHSYRNSHHMKNVTTNEDGQTVHHLVLAEEVSFFNKANVLNVLEHIPANSKVIIDCSNSKAIAHDVVELIVDYKTNAKNKNITVETINFKEPK